MQEKKTERAPGSYEDFVAYLGTVRTEEELFSPLTYWFVGQNCPEDVCFRPQLVEARAKELGFYMVVESEGCEPDGVSEVTRCFEYLKSLDK